MTKGGRTTNQSKYVHLKNRNLGMLLARFYSRDFLQNLEDFLVFWRQHVEDVDSIASPCLKVRKQRINDCLLFQLKIEPPTGTNFHTRPSVKVNRCWTDVETSGQCSRCGPLDARFLCATRLRVTGTSHSLVMCCSGRKQSNRPASAPGFAPT